jgi:diguanylate cyclase (GGDEF)-like protein
MQTPSPPEIALLQAENAAFRSRIELLERDKQDLEIALETAVEHGDAIESQLEENNRQMQEEVADRRLAEKRLQKLLDILTVQKDDLELLLQTITEHSDQVDFAWLEKFDVADQEARHDALTGVANRRHFDEYLAQQWKLSLRNQTPLAFILCDIDSFKLYNDHYGHLAGDACLKKVALALQDACPREVDLVARYGGEEFCVLMPDTDMSGAIAVANRIQDGIRQLALPHIKSPIGIVTLSQGVVSLVASSQHNANDMIATADSLLYSSKQKGKNRFTV